MAARSEGGREGGGEGGGGGGGDAGLDDDDGGANVYSLAARMAVTPSW